MPQSTKREGFVLGPKGRLRSAAKQEPPTVGETSCLYETKKSSQDDCSNFVAEREGLNPVTPCIACNCLGTNTLPYFYYEVLYILYNNYIIF